MGGVGGSGASLPLTMFVELHAQSAFSFLEGAEQPETLVAEAARLEMGALALVDRDGVYGAPRFYHAAVSAGITPRSEEPRLNSSHIQKSRMPSSA